MSQCPDTKNINIPILTGKVNTPRFCKTRDIVRVPLQSCRFSRNLLPFKISNMKKKRKDSKDKRSPSENETKQSFKEIQEMPVTKAQRMIRIKSKETEYQSKNFYQIKSGEGFSQQVIIKKKKRQTRRKFSIGNFKHNILEENKIKEIFQDFSTPSLTSSIKFGNLNSEFKSSKRKPTRKRESDSDIESKSDIQTPTNRKNLFRISEYCNFRDSFNSTKEVSPK